MKHSWLVSIFFYSIVVSGGELSYDDLWKRIREQSPELQQEDHQRKAAGFASERADLHWLPSLSLGGQVYATDDPGNHFFSTLSERQISSADFSSTQLNQPGQSIFERVSLGFDLPLYEGGRKRAQAKAAKKLEEAETAVEGAMLARAYSETATAYATIGSVRDARQRLNELQTELGRILSRYSIGEKSNPVGYSGRLGLQNLENRIKGALIECESGEATLFNTLSERAQILSPWEPKVESRVEFLDRVLSLENQSSISFSEKTARAKAEAGDWMKSAQSAYYLPKIGLFAEEDLTHGSRDTGMSFTGGIYLQWSLFHPERLGRVTEANEQKMAAEAYAQGIRQSETISKKNLSDTDRARRKNWELLIESDALLREQVKIASRLFQAGSITALSLAEVLNRRVDLIMTLKELEQAMIESRGHQWLLGQGERNST